PRFACGKASQHDAGAHSSAACTRANCQGWEWPETLPPSHVQPALNWPRGPGGLEVELFLQPAVVVAALRQVQARADRSKRRIGISRHPPESAIIKSFSYIPIREAGGNPIPG